MPRMFRAWFVLCVAVVLHLSIPTLLYAEEETIRASVSSTGEEGDAKSFNPSISAHGQYTAFESEATNLVCGDGNFASDVFFHSRITGMTYLISVHTSGAQGNDESHRPSITPDGTYIAFDSLADNLVGDDNNDNWDVFIHNILGTTTTRISVDQYGGDPAGGSSAPSISEDGRYVAFQSSAWDLVPGDTNGKNDIFVRDRLLDQTVRVSVSSSGDQADEDCSWPSISPDGRYVAFESYATNLVPNDTNYDKDIFVHDTKTGQTVRVSVDSAGVEANHKSDSARMASHGLVVFHSWASNLVPGDSGGYRDVFLHDMSTGQTVRISEDASGNEGKGDSYSPAITSDGRYVTFCSAAHNLVAGDYNKAADIFVHNMLDGEKVIVSKDSSGVQGNYHSYPYPSISRDGFHVAFVSKATNLVPGDNNFVEDVFVHSRLSLTVDTDELPEAGGTVNFFLEAGDDNAYRGYLLLGGVSATVPGTPLPGGKAILPLNWDAFTNIVIALMNTAIFSNFMGTLDATGQGTAQMNAPALPAGSAGLKMYFAYCLTSPCDFSSNPVAVEVVP